MDEPSWLDRTRGYIDLAMYDEAWKELERLPPHLRASARAREMRIIIRLDQQNLEEAFSLSESLCELHPECHAGYIQGAYCLHALGRTEEAIEHLQSGPDTLLGEPLYFYNLACYELALGKPQTSMAWLRQSIEMDRHYRAKALVDPDLAELRDEI